MTISFPKIDEQKASTRCRVTIMTLNILVAGTLGYMTGRWVDALTEQDVAQAAAGFTGYMSVMALEYGRILTRAYAALLKMRGPFPWG
jgi:hypothetical protein